MPEGKHILITGGAGFIGSHVVRHWVLRYPEVVVHNLDALTYAGNLENLSDVEDAPNYRFHHLDICESEPLQALFDTYRFDAVIHLAAESHVDRSIQDRRGFLKTNVEGTMNLLDCCLRSWKSDLSGRLFLHISTDEVYGSLGMEGAFTETTPYAPNSPYAASKAASDHFVRAYGQTYGLPYIITHCSNNFGPNQFPEKFIPLLIHNAMEQKEIPVYGDGSNQRDWLFVTDHVLAIDQIFHQAEPGQSFGIGSGENISNLDLAQWICALIDTRLGRKPGTSAGLIRFVKDRPGHDHRYAIDSSKLTQLLGWRPEFTMEKALQRTVDWYLENTNWLKNVTSGAYQAYYAKQYPPGNSETQEL